MADNQARCELSCQLNGWRNRNNFSRSSEVVNSNNRMVHNSAPNGNESLPQDFLEFKSEMREILGHLIQKDKSQPSALFSRGQGAKSVPACSLSS